MIDIIVLVAVTFLLDAVLGAFVPAPMNLEKGFVLDAIGKMLLVAGGCGLVLLRGERLADIGLKRPASWTRTFVIGIALAAIVFIVMYLSEKAGFRRDLSKFKPVQGNPELAVLGVLYALIGAGFYEEFTFRGFLMQGLAMMFGGSRGAWIVACIVQGALFGAAARLPESPRSRDHWHAWHFDGPAGSRVGPQSLAGDHRARTVRRESFRFVLFSRRANWLICSAKLYVDAAGVTAPGYRCSTIFSAVQQARVELEIDRRRDADAFEIAMFRIEKKICVGGTDHAR